MKLLCTDPTHAHAAHLDEDQIRALVHPCPLPTPEPVMQTPQSFVLLGDSLFQRAFSQDKDSTGQTIGSLGPRLSDAYARKLDVLNRGFSGYNTRQMLTFLRSGGWKPSSHDARTVAILLGANDARLPDTPGGPQQHVPLDEFRSNLLTIVRTIRSEYSASPPKHVILVTPPPIDERMTVEADSKKDPALNVVRRRAATTAKYASAVRSIGREAARGQAPGSETDHSIKVLDLWSIMIDRAQRSRQSGAAKVDSDYLDEKNEAVADSGNGSSTSADSTPLPGSSEAPPNEILRSYLVDGLHFSRKGYDLFYDELMALLDRKWPAELPEERPMATPAWDALDTWTAKGQLLSAKSREVAELETRMMCGIMAVGCCSILFFLWLFGFVRLQWL